jgi:hypothetical protein
MSKLFRVNVSTDIVVVAASREEAELEALRVVSEGLVPDDLDHGGASEVRDAHDLPFGWDDTCLPYSAQNLGLSDEKTIGELLAEKP